MTMAPGELIVDSFAGGGGASLGIRQALGRGPDIAINHDPEAVALHAVNHPEARHYRRNVWHVDPVEAVAGKPVGLAWFSPDCKHFSKAKGGKPVKRHIRDLAWVVVHWARRVRPRVICIENVEEFRDWGPVAVDGKPCPDRRGATFEQWAAELRRLGYRVAWRELRACDHGAPTIRKRLFLVARRDGRPIVWPEPTHGAPDDPEVLAGRKRPYRTAAGIIDWSLPCPSIFLTREEGRAAGVNRPLADATLRRIARGVAKYVLESPQPFLVPITHSGGDRVHPSAEPLRTVTTAHRGEIAVAAPYFVQRYGERDGQEPRTRPVAEPAQTVVPTGNGAQLVAAFLAQHNTGVTGHDARAPVSTVTQRGTQQGLVVAHMLNMKGADRRARGCVEPLSTVCAGASHAGVVAGFLAKYYGTALGQDAREPLHTATAKARFGAVTVTVDGETFELVDIGMRMLSPRELFRAQGFPDDYAIDATVDGKALTKTTQIRLCGNSVCPQVAAAVVRAQFAGEMAEAGGVGVAA